MKNSIAISVVAACAPVFLSPTVAAADRYKMLSGGLTSIDSSRTNKPIVTYQNPSGFRSGHLEFDFTAVDGVVSLVSGQLSLSDFHVKLGSGLIKADFDALQTTMHIYNGADGILEKNKGVLNSFNYTVMAPSDSADGVNGPAIETLASFENCSGALCFVTDSLDLNIQSYRLALSFSSDRSTVTGELEGLTANGSVLAMVFNAERIE